VTGGEGLEQERQVNALLGLAVLVAVLWLGTCGLQAASCVPEADEADGPVPAASSHTRGLL
jgi:hypothetical protein